MSKLASDPHLKTELKETVNHLLNHLYNLYTTFDEIRTSNHNTILEGTGGTFIIPKREMRTVIDSIPIFSGDSSDNSTPWSDVQAALNKIPEIKA